MRHVLVIGVGVAVAGFGGCIAVESGDTVLHVDAADRAEEKHIRSDLWRVQKAVSEVRVRYGLEDVAVRVSVRELGGLGETTPAFDGLHVKGATFVLNKRLFTDQHPDLDAIILGLTSHELAHALHYARMSRADALELGLRYDRMMSKPEGPDHDWIRAYEQVTDMTAIALGFGEALIHQKKASEANLAANHPPKVWDFYLHEHEIRSLMEDRDLLRARTREALATLGLRSLESLLDHPAFDEDGDLIFGTQSSLSPRERVLLVLAIEASRGEPTP